MIQKINLSNQIDDSFAWFFRMLTDSAISLTIAPPFLVEWSKISLRQSFYFSTLKKSQSVTSLLKIRRLENRSLCFLVDKYTILISPTIACENMQHVPHCNNIIVEMDGQLNPISSRRYHCLGWEWKGMSRRCFPRISYIAPQLQYSTLAAQRQ